MPPSSPGNVGRAHNDLRPGITGHVADSQRPVAGIDLAVHKAGAAGGSTPSTAAVADRPGVAVVLIRVAEGVNDEVGPAVPVEVAGRELRTESRVIIAARRLAAQNNRVCRRARQSF